jgi:hypothetical protein
MVKKRERRERKAVLSARMAEGVDRQQSKPAIEASTRQAT